MTINHKQLKPRAFNGMLVGLMMWGIGWGVTLAVEWQFGGVIGANGIIFSTFGGAPFSAMQALGGAMVSSGLIALSGGALMGMLMAVVSPMLPGWLALGLIGAVVGGLVVGLVEGPRGAFVGASSGAIFGSMYGLIFEGPSKARPTSDE